MKRFLVLFFSSLLLIFIIMYFRYDTYKLRYLVDVVWLVGVLYFAVGVFTLHNVRRLFRTISFSAKRFMNKDLTHASYYDYYMDKEQQEATTGVPALLVGLIHVIFSLITSYIYFV